KAAPSIVQGDTAFRFITPGIIRACAPSTPRVRRDARFSIRNTGRFHASQHDERERTNQEHRIIYAAPMISVVIPTRQSGDVLTRCFHSLMPAALDGLVREVIVVDAGSTDLTRDIADGAGAKILHESGDLPSRLRAGAASARHPYLLFLSARAALES